eukprot:scaffold7647_cov145-Amphora_coffeaeformis.AAC.1
MPCSGGGNRGPAITCRGYPGPHRTHLLTAALRIGPRGRGPLRERKYYTFTTLPEGTKDDLE